MSDDYDYGIRCPDGEVWPDQPEDRLHAEDWLKGADAQCGCEQSPHVMVRRPVEDWEAVPS